MKKLYLSILAALFIVGARAEKPDNTPSLSIWFDTPNNLDGRAIWQRADGKGENPDKAWETSSLPLGNGSLGANIMGSIAAERITLNEKTLWKGGPNTSGGADYYWNVNKQSAPILKEIRQAFTDGDQKRAETLTRKNFNGLAAYEEKDETPFRFGSFTTMGEVYVETGLNEIGMSDYKRILSLDSAMATVCFLKDGIKYQRNYFISYPDSVMVMRFTADKPGMQNLTFSYSPNTEAQGKIEADGTNGLCYAGKLNNNQMKFALRFRAINKGGTVRVENGELVIKDANEVVFLLTADTDYKMNFNPDFNTPETYVGNNPAETTRNMMKQAEAKTYEALYLRHQNDYTALFNRVKLSLNPQMPIADLPTDQRLKHYR